jgi:hypothetical protein
MFPLALESSTMQDRGPRVVLAYRLPTEILSGWSLARVDHIMSSRASSLSDRLYDALSV